MIEAQELVEAHIRQTGHVRNAIGDRLNTAHLLRDRRKHLTSDACFRIA
jgi:hypothetical protein